jgi:uncharacterized protein (TIGR01244 family)
MNISPLAENYVAAAQIRPADIVAIAAAGFTAVICNRPDNEEPGQPNADEIAAECERTGMTFHHIPVSRMPISESAIEEHRRVIDSSAGPVLGYCRSGQRSTVIWQAGF